jgi:multicomponent Na+:H+ antiporter subunit D
MESLLALPIAIPLVGAGLCVAFARSLRAQAFVCVAGMAAMVLAALAIFDGVRSEGILVLQAGAWPAPYGISLVADLVSAALVLMASLMGTAVAVYSAWSVDEERRSFFYFPLLLVLMLGVQGSFLTGDLFNLYVCFEVMLMASFVLLTLGGERRQMEGGVKYVILNLLSSAVFLTATGLLYGAVGTLNLADIHNQVALSEDRDLMDSLAMLFLVAFGLKAALFPFSFWLPASYHTPPFAVSAIFAGLLTKVGVYALLRTFTLMFVGDTDFTHTVLAIVACASILVGGLGALVQQDLRRVFSFQIITTGGFMALGIALATPVAIAAVVFYLVVDIATKTNLFLLGGVAERLRGGGRLEQLGGLWRSHPYLSLMLLLSLLTLAGVPPLPGFWPKLGLIQTSIEVGEEFLIAILVAGSFLSLFAVARVFARAVWKDAELPGPEEADAPRRTEEVRWMLLPPTVLTVLIVVFGAAAGPLFDYAQSAAEQVLDPAQYVRAVLGEGR